MTKVGAFQNGSNVAVYHRERERFKN